jgi:hypothetical protein
MARCLSEEHFHGGMSPFAKGVQVKPTLALSLLILLVSACAPKGQYAPFNLTPSEKTQPASSGISSGSPPATGSGVRGQVLIGPSCPVIRIDNPCPDQPYQANLTVFSLDGQKVTRFSSGADGKFEIQLPPGNYILHPESPDGRPIPSAADVPFTVLPDQFSEVVVTFDSRIR